MHLGRDGWRFVGASLALGLGVALATGAEPADAKAKANGWRWWPSWGKSQEQEKPPEDPPEPTPTPPQVKTAGGEPYHLTVYFRRELVCDRLSEVAMQTGDEELASQAEKLRDRAWAIYLDRSGLKPGTFGGQVPRADAPAAGAGVAPVREEGE